MGPISKGRKGREVKGRRRDRRKREGREREGRKCRVPPLHWWIQGGDVRPPSPPLIPYA